MSGAIDLGGRNADSFAFARRRRWWEMFGGDSPVPPFDPTTIANIAFWLRADAGVTTTTPNADGSTRTVTVLANIGTFNATMDAGLTPSVGDIVTVAGVDYVVGARTSGTVWALTGPNVVASAFTVRRSLPYVATWADQSGLGRDFTGLYTLAPSPSGCFLRTVNLRPVVDSAIAFSNANNFLANINGLAFGNNKPGTTLAFVVTSNATADNSFFCQAGQNASTVKRLCIGAQTGGAVRFVTRRIGGGANLTLTDLTTIDARTRCIIVLTVDWVTGAVTVYKNGGAAAYAAVLAWPAGGNWSAADLNALRVGGPQLSYLEAVLAYDRVLTDPERAYITDGLGTDFGIVVTP